MTDQNPVPTLIRASFAAAGRQTADEGDMTAATIAALRKLRRLLSDQVNDEVARQIVDGPVANLIMERNLREFSRTGHEPEPVALPLELTLAGPASVVMQDAVDSGLILHKILPNNSALALMVPELTACLFETLGGAPDTGTLLSLLRDGAGTVETPAPASQRLH